MINPKSEKLFAKMLDKGKFGVHASYEDYLIQRGKQYDKKR